MEIENLPHNDNNDFPLLFWNNKKNNNNNKPTKRTGPVAATVHEVNELGAAHRMGNYPTRNNLTKRIKVQKNLGKIQFNEKAAKLVANAIAQYNDPENALEWVLNQNSVHREIRKRAAKYINSIYLDRNINNVNYGLDPKPLKRRAASRKLVKRNPKAHSRVHNLLKPVKNEPNKGK
jgi:ribosomal 50S subunit-associated protein YjgA (DUF615 family)